MARRAVPPGPGRLAVLIGAVLPDIAYKGLHDVRWFVCSDWQDRSLRLYRAAAEVASVLDGQSQ